jgi:hypothetical protein
MRQDIIRCGSVFLTTNLFKIVFQLLEGKSALKRAVASAGCYAHSNRSSLAIDDSNIFSLRQIITELHQTRRHLA